MFSDKGEVIHVVTHYVHVVTRCIHVAGDIARELANVPEVNTDKLMVWLSIKGSTEILILCNVRN